MDLLKRGVIPVFLLVGFGELAHGQASLGPIVRIDSGVSGHIHPALAITNKGTLVATYCKSEYKPFLITRSTDQGKTWSKPALVPHTSKSDVYPGSLTALSDGRLVHAWNVWYSAGEKQKSRFVAYSISADDGLTWSQPQALAKANHEKTGSVVRHPFVELTPTRWLIPLMDRTIVWDADQKSEAPFASGENHGLVPIVSLGKATLVSGMGKRTDDAGKTWTEIKPFPDVRSQGWRHQMIGLKNGTLLASRIEGPGVGGLKIQFVLSRDGGRSWDLDQPVEFYDPGRPIGGRACPKTVEMEGGTLGTIFYDTDPKQDGGSGIFFRTMKLP